MASATVGVLRVILTADSADFDAAMKKAAGAAQTWSGHLQKVGQQVSNVGSALTKSLTLPIAAIGVTSVKAAMDFESSFANVAKTVDGVSDAAGKLTPKGEALAQTFRTMAKEIPATTAELTAIAALGGQMGVPIDNLEKFTKNVAALGVAVDGISAEEAAMGLAQIANVFGDKEVKNIDSMSSALVHLGNNSNATEGDILEFTKRLSGAGAAAGMTVPEVMAIGTAMANVGINAEAGGTAMSTMIQKMSMAVSEGGSKLQAFDDIVKHTGQSFTELWKGSPTEAVNAVVVGLGKAKESGQDLNLVVREIGATNIRTADTMKRLAGAGDGIATSLKTANEGWTTGNKHLEEAQKKYATTANQLKILQNQITDIGITIGNALLPAIKSMISLLSTMLPIIEGIAHAFAALPGPIQAVIVGLGLVLAAAGPVLFIFGQLIQSAGTVIGIFATKGAAARALALILGETSTAAATTATNVTAVGTASAGAAPKVVTFGTAVKGVAAAFGTIAAVGTWLWALHHTVTAVQSLNEIMRQGNERLGAFRMSLSNLFSLPGLNSGLMATLVQMALGQAPGPAAPRPGGVPQAPLGIGLGAAFRNLGRGGTGTVIPSRGTGGGDINLPVETKPAAAAVAGATKGVETLGDKLDALSASVKAADKEIAGLSATTRGQLTAAFKSGAFSIKELKDETGLSELVLERFKRQLDDSAKSHKQVEKAASDHEKELARLQARLEKQRDALQKLGIVTRDTVNDALDEFATLVQHAADAGVPMDRILAAINPKLVDLKAQADASGIKVRALDDALRTAAEAATRVQAALRADIFAGLKPAIDGLQELPGTVVEIYDATDEAARSAGLLTESFHHFGLKTRAELLQTARESEAHYNFIKRSGVASAEQIQAAFDKMRADQIAAGIEVESVWSKRLKILGETLKGIGLTAGHDFAGILADGISTGDWSQFENQFKQVASEAIGSGLAAGVDFLVPGLGKMLQPLFTAIADKFLGALGLGTKGRDLVKEFAESMGGFDALHGKLATLGAAGEQMWVQLTQGVGKNNPQQAQAAIDAITAALGRAEAEMEAFNTALGGMLAEIQALGTGLPESLVEYLRGLEEAGQLTQENIDLLNELAGQGEADWRKIQEAVERYGGDISKLGGTFQAQRLHDSWQQVIDDMALFEAGGMDAAAMLDLTQGKIIELVQESQRFGTEIPENMRPWIQKLIDSGELVDDTGQKITDIGKLKFGETLQTSLEKLTLEIRNLITALGGVPAAARTAAQGAEEEFNKAKPRLKVAVEYDDPGPRPSNSPAAAATGGLVTPWGVQYKQVGGVMASMFRPRGTDTVPAMLTPGEVILNEAHQATIGDTLAAAMRTAQALFHAPALVMDAVQRSAGTGGAPLQTVTIMEVDKRELGRAVADVLPGELRRLGVRVLA